MISECQVKKNEEVEEKYIVIYSFEMMVTYILKLLKKNNIVLSTKGEYIGFERETEQKEDLLEIPNIMSRSYKTSE